MRSLADWRTSDRDHARVDGKGCNDELRDRLTNYRCDVGVLAGSDLFFGDFRICFRKDLLLPLPPQSRSELLQR